MAVMNLTVLKNQHNPKLDSLRSAIKPDTFGPLETDQCSFPSVVQTFCAGLNTLM